MAMNTDLLQSAGASAADLLQAQAGGALELHYQPLLDGRSGEIVAVEALLRWHHPVHGLLAGADFLPPPESGGLPAEVGRWVVDAACRQLRAWLDRGLRCPAVAVNVSAAQFSAPDFVASVGRALAASSLPPGSLELEFAESLLDGDMAGIVRVLDELRRLGVRLAIDDFGRACTGLSRLRDCPVDVVKLDRALVREITADTGRASIARALIGMAHNLKLAVSAEGVETAAELAALQENRCDRIQGYHFSQVIPAEAMENLLADRAAMPPMPAGQPPRERTILLVDDEENILAALRRLLRRDGYRILTAGGGQAGLQLLAENTVDVIVSDQRMPNMTGVEFLRQVKALYPETVRLVLSGYTELQSITDAINEGAIYKFLTKPWEDDLLRANIEEAFRYKELADENRRLSAELQVANLHLARANEQLLETLAEKDRRIERDETSLDVAQELLQCIPFPIVGFDAGATVVFANVEAERMFGDGGSLLGVPLDDRLAPPLRELLDGADGAAIDWNGGGGCWRALHRRLGHGGHEAGRLLLLLPAGGAR